MRILVVEDDEVTADLIGQGLRRAGFDVDVAGDGLAGQAAAMAQEYDLVVLDLMLPGIDGVSLCRGLRERRQTVPILMLTALDAVDDRVRGLEAGADDYLPKPFAFRELVARAQALVRRDRIHKTRVVRIADLEMDTTSRRVWRGGEEITLTGREYSLLEALASQEGRTLTRDTILDRVWRDDESLSDTISFHVSTLRRKVDAGHAVKLIHTVYGVGYVLRAPLSQAAS